MALDFNTEPYFDDYDPKKDFYRVLFRPSYAVQARELTQMQTILQNQVSRFGDHVFKNGSQVIPGSVNVDNKVHFIKLEQFTGTVDVTTYIETFKNKIITGETSGVKMRVLDTSGGSAVVDQLSVPTLYCKVEGTASDTVTNRLQPGENVIAYADDNLISTNFRLTEDQLTDINAVIKLTGSNSETPTTYTNNESSDVIGYGYSVDVGAGIYYIDGTFVRNDDLKLYVSRFNNTPSCRVGFKITEETVAPEDDESILDNATGSYNFAAPGAHRFKISLSLVKLPLTGTDTIKFVELVRIVEGRVHQKVTSSSYAELEKTMARRTYDESGNYETNKFKLSVREHSNNGTNQGIYTPLADGGIPTAGVTYGNADKFCLVVDPGKAYIQGYEVESSATQFVDIDKARVINGEENNHVVRTAKQTVGLNYGNYVEVNNLYKMPDVANYERVYLVKTLHPRVAQFNATVTAGAITALTKVDGGYGYTGSWTADASAIVSKSTTGSGAVVTATVSNGQVTSMGITTAGTNYPNTIPPDVNLNNTTYISLNAPASTNNIVGTARVRSIELSDYDTVRTKSVYKLGLFDINMFSGYSFERDVKGVIGINPSDNFSCNINPVTYAIPGTATANQSSSLVDGQGTVFASTVKIGDVIYLNDQLAGTVAQIVADGTYTGLGNYQIRLSGNSLVAATNARITVFSAKLELPTYESLLFPIGQSNIKTLRGYLNGADTFKDSDIFVRRKFPIHSSTNASVTWELNADNEYFLSDEQPENYLLVNANTYLPVQWTTDTQTTTYVTFDSNDNRKVVTFNNVPPGKDYFLIATVRQVLGSAQEATKTLNKIDGSMTLESKRVVTANTINLNHGDIFKLVSVEMTPDDGTYTFDQDNVVDITDRYELDNGQRSSYYTYGKLNLKPGQPVPNGPIRVKYWFFTYSRSGGNGGNYFSVDSYPLGTNGITYEEIPSYKTTDPVTGKSTEISLTDVVDFRPVLTTTNGWNPEMPSLGSDMACPRASYVGRIDKIALDSFGRFNIITGVPSENPKEPIDPKEGMVLATIAVPPYTKSVKDVAISQRENRRYTMRDIGRLEKRISNLEYYVTLSLLEKDTASLSVIDATTGLDRFKNGFIVDQFTGHNVGDVKHKDYRIAIDAKNKVLRPMHYTNSVDIVEDLTSGSERGSKTYQKSGDLITLPYSEQDYIFNKNATRSMDVRSLSMGAFKGQVYLFPEGDNWKSINRQPDLKRNDDTGYDAIKYVVENVLGTQWGEWADHWTSSTPIGDFSTSTTSGRLTTTYITTLNQETGYQTRNGINTTVQQGGINNSQDFGDRIVDLSYIPYMRARPVTFVAQNLKGLTRFYPFFDRIPVKDYVKPADVFKVTRISNSLMNFELADLQNNILQDDPRRGYNGVEYRDVTGEGGGRIEPAFGFGDIITNGLHTATNIVSIANLTTAATTFTMVVSDTNNLYVGNHVVLYNLNYHNATEVSGWEDYSGTVLPVSNKLVNPSLSSKQLNLKTFKIVAKNGGTLTLANLDGSEIQPFDAYSTDSYQDLARGKLYRLKASGVVAYGGMIHSSDTIGPIQQDIHVVNIKNGFGIGEPLKGEVTIGSTGSYNGCTIDAINGATTNITMKSIGSYNVTDDDGTVVGVFYLPESDALSFRTGERTFKLTDNSTNSDASFDSVGSAVYYAQGISLDKERTVVSTRATNFIQSAVSQDSRDLGLPPIRRTTTNTRVIYQYSTDPLAQTFVINNPGGAFVTSLDLYFSEAGRRPTWVELRPTDNGVPSATKTIPFSTVVLTPSEIKTSDDSSVPTTFKFKSPIYLQDNETYAFVVATDEPGAQLYVSEMGLKDMLTGNTIAGQPLTGSLYASQNAQEWEIHPLLDMKFTLRTAKFNTNSEATLYLKNLPPEKVSLGVDPFKVTTGSTLIRVKAKDHGLMAGQSVTISGVPKGFHGSVDPTKGIPDTLLNRTHTVYEGDSQNGIPSGIDKDSFLINLVTTEAGTGNNLLSGTTADFQTGQYGGSTVSCTRGFYADMMYLKTSDLNFTDTKVDYYVKPMTTGAVISESWLPLVSNNDYAFSSRMMIPSLENYNVVNNVQVAPLQIKAVLSSSNTNVSPVIDLQQLSAYAISNLIDDTSASKLNVPTLDTRVLLQYGDVVDSDRHTDGTGTISVTTGTTGVTGNGTTFRTQVFVGNKLYKKSNGTLIGTVASVASTAAGDTALTLAANSPQTLSAEAFYIETDANLVFANNADGFGKISTTIDTADNLLASAGVGKVLVIENIQTGINGTYNITNVEVVDDRTMFAGNPEYDMCVITLDRAFSAPATINMLTEAGGDFKISMIDKYVGDTAPYGSSNMANYVTRTLSVTEPADVIKVMFDANIPNGTTVKVYYRAWTGSDVNLNRLRWTDTGYVSDAKDVGSDFVEREVTTTGIPAFNNVQIKIVMKSTNPAVVPKIKNLRLLALS